MQPIQIKLNMYRETQLLKPAKRKEALYHFKKVWQASMGSELQN